MHVQPRARKTEVVGWHGDAVKVRVAAPPAGGAANAALIRFLAERLGIPPSTISLMSGAGSRRKRVALQGITAEHALAALGLR
jgi:uncharacterized protein (TIGR00251 family)